MSNGPGECSHRDEDLLGTIEATDFVWPEPLPPIRYRYLGMVGDVQQYSDEADPDIWNQEYPVLKFGYDRLGDLVTVKVYTFAEGDGWEVTIYDV